MPVKFQRRTPGFALVEALVALVLLSAALAGSALLLVQALRHERIAGERGIALRHAASLADTLRALRRADRQPLQAVTDPGVPPTCPAYPGDCLLELRAASQIDAWRAALVAELPGESVASVDWLPGPPAAYVLSIAWPSAGNAAGPVAPLRLLVQP